MRRVRDDAAIMTPQQFIAHWRDDRQIERAASQTWFNDLCDTLDVDKPDDPERYCFERGATRTGSGRGWADVWKRGCFGWENKGPGGDLGGALKQLMTYALALDNPPLLIVSDRLKVEIHTHFTGTPSEAHTIALDDLGTPENLQKLRWCFTDPDRFKPTRTRIAITKQAADLIGDLAWQLQQRKSVTERFTPQQIAHFLNKLIFCLFAEDAEGPGFGPLLPERLFGKLLDNGLKDTARFEKQLKNLFAAMSAKDGEFGEHLIEWFNGGLFDDDLVIPLNKDDILELVNVARLDWSAIEPSIFGTLFERGLDPAKRSQLGAHYTDPDSIMRIVGPVIEEPLLAEWADTKAKIAALIDVVHAHERSTKASDKGKATTALKEAVRLHVGFLERLKNFRVLDPACGSGNFLYMALQALKDIELRVILEAEELGLERALPQVDPECVLGIEINPYAAELARVTVWIGEIQWMLKHGFGPSRNPILQRLNQIECRDALLLFPPIQGEGQGDGSIGVAEARWPKVDVIIGNPPFLGGNKKRRELGEATFDALNRLYGAQVPGAADLVCYWFAKARMQIDSGHAQRAGLVATQSIRNGASRKVLDAIVNDCVVTNAWSDEPWVNEGAAVRVSLICFANRMEMLDSIGAVLNDRAVTTIGADLTGGASDLSVLAAMPLPENRGVCFQGSQKIGGFGIDGTLARTWLVLPNPHGKPNREVLKPSWNGLDVTRRARDGWIVDFGTRMLEADAARYEAPFQFVVSHVKPKRMQNNREVYRRYWWRHGEPRIALRVAIAPLARFIVTPETSKHRVFVWAHSAVLPDKKLMVTARDDDVSFGILQARMHEVWALALGSIHGDGEDGGRPRYTPTTCFETFPFPEGLTPHLVPADYANPHADAIVAAAKQLDTLRNAWLNPPEWVDVVPEVAPGYPDRIIPNPEFAKAIKERTLTNLYNKRVKGEAVWLDNAHRALDAAVAAAYGWTDYTPDMPDDEILRRLLALNLARANPSPQNA